MTKKVNTNKTNTKLRYTIIEKENLYWIIDELIGEKIGTGYFYLGEAIMDCRILNRGDVNG